MCDTNSPFVRSQNLNYAIVKIMFSFPKNEVPSTQK
jgi:hypothetical protein